MKDGRGFPRPPNKVTVRSFVLVVLPTQTRLGSGLALAVLAPRLELVIKRLLTLLVEFTPIIVELTVLAVTPSVEMRVVMVFTRLAPPLVLDKAISPARLARHLATHSGRSTADMTTTPTGIGLTARIDAIPLLAIVLLAIAARSTARLTRPITAAHARAELTGAILAIARPLRRLAEALTIIPLAALAKITLARVLLTKAALRRLPIAALAALITLATLMIAL